MRFTKLTPQSSMDAGRTSSVYSNDSEKKATYLDYRNGPNGRPESSATSYTPSYMSSVAARPVETPVATSNARPSSHVPSQDQKAHSISTGIPRKPVTNPAELSDTNLGPSATPGILLVLTAGRLHPSTIFNLEMLLSRQNFASIVIVVSKEQAAELRQLRMDVYALLGKLRKEMNVYTHEKESWSQAEMEATLHEATRSGMALQGVLCCPEFEETGTMDVDVLGLSVGQLEQSWKESVAFLHAAIRATVTQLLERSKPTNSSADGISGRALRGPFFLVASSTTYAVSSQITKSACDTLVSQLEKATKAKGLAVGYAEVLLVPEPVLETAKTPKAKDATSLPPDTYDAGQDDMDFTAGESPTKLWNMWSLQNDLGYIDD